MNKQSTSKGPSWVRFYTSDYLAGTANMTREIRSIYDDIMWHNLDKCRPMSEAEARLIFADLPLEVWDDNLAC